MSVYKSVKGERMGTAEKLGKAMAQAVFYVNKAGEVLDCRNRGAPPHSTPDDLLQEEEKVPVELQGGREPHLRLSWRNQPETVIVHTQLEFAISVDPKGHEIQGVRLLANSEPVTPWTTNQKLCFEPGTPGEYSLEAELCYIGGTATSNQLRVEVLKKNDMWERLVSQVSWNPEPAVRLVVPQTYKRGIAFIVEAQIDPRGHQVDAVAINVDGEIWEYLVNEPYQALIILDEGGTHRLSATVDYNETRETESSETEVFEMTAPETEEPQAQHPSQQDADGASSSGAQPISGVVPPLEQAPPANFPPPQTQPPSEPPTIRLYSPDIRQGLIPHQIRLVAEVQSNGHSINEVFFRDNDGNFLGSIGQEPYVLPWTPSHGVHNVRAQLEYDGGEVLSNELTIIVEQSPTVPTPAYYPPARPARDRAWIGDALVLLGALVALGILGALVVLGFLAWIPAAVAAIFIVAIAALFLLEKWSLAIAALVFGAILLLLFFALPSLDGIREAIREDGDKTRATVVEDGDKTRETVTSEHDKTRQTLTSEIEEEGEAVRDHVTKEHNKTRATVKSEAEKTRSQMTTTTVRRSAQPSTTTTKASAPVVVAPPLSKNPAPFETDLGFNDVGIHTAAPSASENPVQSGSVEPQEQETIQEQENTDITGGSGYTAPPSASD